MTGVTRCVSFLFWSCLLMAGSQGGRLPFMAAQHREEDDKEECGCLGLLAYLQRILDQVESDRLATTALLFQPGGGRLEDGLFIAGDIGSVHRRFVRHDSAAGTVQYGNCWFWRGREREREREDLQTTREEKKGPDRSTYILVL